MTPLDERERRVALWAAAFAAVTSIVFYAPGFDEFTVAIVLALVGVVMAALLALAARSGRRLLTTLAAGLLAIGPWGFAYIIGLPFVILAGWLMYRDANARRANQPPRTPRRRPLRQRPPENSEAEESDAEESEAEESRSGKGTAANGKADKRKRAPRGKKVKEPCKGETAKPARPTASKRYTPPGGRR